MRKREGAMGAAKSDLCRNCGYDLRGQPVAADWTVRCTECGMLSIVTRRGLVQPWRWRLTPGQQFAFLSLMFFLPTIAAMGLVVLVWFAAMLSDVLALCVATLGFIAWILIVVWAGFGWASRILGLDAHPRPGPWLCLACAGLALVQVAVNVVITVIGITLVGTLLELLAFEVL